MLNKRNLLWIYFKILITSLFFFYTSSIFIVLIQKLSNVIFNTRFIANFDTLLNFSFVIPSYLFLSLLLLSNLIYITKGIRIDDKDVEIVRIKQVMANMNWKLKEENVNTIIFRSPFAMGLWLDEIIVEFIDNEVHIKGPRNYVNSVISRSKFLYTPYEIKNQKQEG